VCPVGVPFFFLSISATPLCQDGRDLSARVIPSRDHIHPFHLFLLHKYTLWLKKIALLRLLERTRLPFFPSRFFGFDSPLVANSNSPAFSLYHLVPPNQKQSSNIFPCSLDNTYFFSASARLNSDYSPPSPLASSPYRPRLR